MRHNPPTSKYRITQAVVKDNSHSDSNGTGTLQLTKNEAEAIRMLRKHPRLGSPMEIVLLGQLTAYGQIDCPTASSPRPAS